MLVTQRVMNTLRERIVSGNYRDGEQLPPLRELSEELNSSYVMVSRAIRALKAEGLLETYPGRGTFISSAASQKALPGGGRRIAFIFADPAENPREEYQLELFTHIQQLLRDAGYLDLALSCDESELEEPEMTAGAIIIHRSRLLPKFREKKIPVVYCSSNAAESYFSGVSPDFYAGSYLVTRHLIEAGHRKIGVVLTAEDDNRASFIMRHQGYLDAMSDAGLSPVPPVRWHAKQSTAGLKELLISPGRPTALFVANDHMAVEVMEFCRELGIGIPSGLSICGLENMRSSQSSIPPLTTAGYNLKTLAAEAVSLLFALIDGREQGAIHKKIPMTLESRNTVRTNIIVSP